MLQVVVVVGSVVNLFLWLLLHEWVHSSWKHLDVLSTLLSEINHEKHHPDKSIFN